MNLAARKPDFGVCGQVRLNPACNATETSKNVVIKHVVIKHVVIKHVVIESVVIKHVSRQAAWMLRVVCASAVQLLLSCNKVILSRGEVHIIMQI